MITTYVCLTIILLGSIYIAKLSAELRKEKKRTTEGPHTSTTTDELFLIIDACFESSHDAVALFDDEGFLVLSNAQFKKQFPEPLPFNDKPGICSFFPEMLWLMLLEGLSRSQFDKKEVLVESSIENKHYVFTFSPVIHQSACTRIFLFCKELSSPENAIPNHILQLANSATHHVDGKKYFNQVIPDICEAMDSDEMFFLDTQVQTGEILNQDKSHGWILSIPVWMDLLRKGKTIQNFTENFDPEEQKILKQKAIKVFLLLPLIVDKELLGILGTYRTSNASLFTQNQINSLLLIADILAMAISNQNDRLERDRLLTVMEQSSDCIIIINSRGIVLYANPACEDITGFSPEEVIGNSIKTLFIPSIRRKLWPMLKGPLKAGESWSGQFRNYRKDSKQYEEEMIISHVHGKDGKISNQVIVKRDITEDKRLESIAEAANLMDNIGFIFSSIRHELGNPINSIKVSLSVLESNLESYDTKDVTRFIRRSLSDIGRVEYLLKTLRNFSIFEKPDIHATNMRSLLNKLILLAEKDLAKHNITLAIDHCQEPLIGMIDPRAFLQVLLNLTTNGVAALEGRLNKKITISLLKKEDKQVALLFEDNGCGMDKETARNLFRPFFTTKAEGTGLGLVIVKKMLAKMNCSITARSEEGVGTRMEIIIPSA
jgi:PAS domain S-box-containing protein